MTTAEKSLKLSARQTALLELVCLKRYTVVFDHYMGSFRPNECVRVDEPAMEGPSDRSFRPATVHSLRERGLVRLVKQGPGRSHVKPTRAGLEHYKASLERFGDKQ